MSDDEDLGLDSDDDEFNLVLGSSSGVATAATATSGDKADSTGAPAGTGSTEANAADPSAEPGAADMDTDTGADAGADASAGADAGADADAATGHEQSGDASGVNDAGAGALPAAGERQMQMQDEQGGFRLTEFQRSCMEAMGITPQNYAQHAFEMNPQLRNHSKKPNAFEMDLDAHYEQGWRRPNANQGDYFNFGLDETSFRQYAAAQVAIKAFRRQEFLDQQQRQQGPPPALPYRTQQAPQPQPPPPTSEFAPPPMHLQGPPPPGMPPGGMASAGYTPGMAPRGHSFPRPPPGAFVPGPQY